MAEYSKIARGSFTFTGSATNPHIVYLPFVPQQVEVWDYTVWGNPTQALNFYTYWNSSLGQGAGINNIWESTGTSPSTPYMTSALQTTGCISTFSNGPGIVYGSQLPVSQITKASSAVVTVSNHGYLNNDVVVFEGLYQTKPNGMPQICGIPFSISSVTTDTFTINWNTNQSNYTMLSGSPVPGAFVKKIINPENYYPGINFISSISLNAYVTTFSLTRISDYVVGQSIAFRIPLVWGTIQLNSGENPSSPGSTVYGTVTSVSQNTIVVNINSASFTPFNSNVPVSAVPGLSFPQTVAVGDFNNGTTYTGVLGSPTISGAFVNNTSAGFIIGPNSVLNTANVSDTILWQATYFDYVQDV